MHFALSAFLFGLWLVMLVQKVDNFVAYGALVLSFVMLVIGFTKRRPPSPNSI